MMKKRLPDWLYSTFNIALAGEIYPQIRAIAVRYSNENEILIRYYLDREPTDFDEESIKVVATNFDAALPIGHIQKLDVECIFSRYLIKDLDMLDGFVFTRREYEMHENPSNEPTYFTPQT